MPIYTHVLQSFRTVDLQTNILSPSSCVPTVVKEYCYLASMQLAIYVALLEKEKKYRGHLSIMEEDRKLAMTSMSILAIV